MKYAYIYNKLDNEVDIMKKYIDDDKQKDEKSEFFESPLRKTLPEQKNTLCKIFESDIGKKSGIYVFICNKDTRVVDIKTFNTGSSISKMRKTDTNEASIKKGDILYIGECDKFSSRLSAHLDDNPESTTNGLHMYANNRINIKPELFDLILFPINDDFYDSNMSENDKKALREIIENKIKAKYLPWVGK